MMAADSIGCVNQDVNICFVSYVRCLLFATTGVDNGGYIRE